MGFLNKIFGTKKGGAEKEEEIFEQAVIVHFNYGIEGMDALYRLRYKLETVIVRDQLGEYDGHEMAMDYSDGFLYMYGPNAEALFKGIKEILDQTEFMQGAKAKLRFGPPEDGVKEIIVEIGK